MKSLFRSKTFWANVLGGAVQVVNQIAGTWDPNILILVQTVLNVAIRMVTKEEVYVVNPDA